MLSSLILASLLFAQDFADPAFIALLRPVAAAGGGGAFVSDTFTDTDAVNLTAHTGETGATWAKVTGVTGNIQITSNRAKGNSGGDSLYYASGTPTTAEYDVEADAIVISAIDNFGICGRLSTGANTCYRARYEHSNTRYALEKVEAGVVTSLGTFSQSFNTVSSTINIRLEIRDATKKVFLDDVERISSTNNDITAAGKAGIWYNNSDWGFGTTGRPVDNFTATNP